MKRFTCVLLLATMVGVASLMFTNYRAQAVSKNDLNKVAVSRLYEHVAKVKAAIDAGKVKRDVALAQLRTHLKQTIGTKRKLSDAELDKFLKITGLIQAAESEGEISLQVAIDKFRELLGVLQTGTKYTRRQVLKVSDPAGFQKLQKKAIFSGPQAGENLPVLRVTGTHGRFEGKEFDPVAKAAGKPQILIFLSGDSDDKPLYWIGDALTRLVGRPTKGLQTCVVYLGDNRTKIRKLAKQADKPKPKGTLIGYSKDGRDGPGAYGLNRHVAMTIIVARKGKVTHNFAFAQPPFYSDPHVLGGVADVIGVERNTFANWLNAEAQKKEPQGQKGQQKGERKGRQTQKGKKDKDYKNRYAIQVKNPEGFKKLVKKGLFSGPQKGEKLPAFKATGVRGKFAGKVFDPVAEAKGKPQILIFQDYQGGGLRGLVASTRILSAIRKKSKKKFHTAIVFLGDDPTKMAAFGKRIQKYIPEEVLYGFTKEGRDGPGAYGLNRKVSQTILVAKGGKVLYNLPFPQGSLFADPYVLGAVAEVLGEKREMVAKWANDANPRKEAKKRPTPNVRKLLAQLRQMDKNKDGKITRKEAGERGQRLFNFADANNDGVVDQAELKSFPARLRKRLGQD